MSTQRYISTSFWDDKWIRSLDPSERYLYMYLLTNTLTTISGIYRITIDRIAYDTGYDERTLKPMLARFAESKKAVFFEDEFMILPSWPKHQKWEKKDTIKAGIEADLENIPEHVKKYSLSIGYQYPIPNIPVPTELLYSDLHSDTDTDTDTHTEEIARAPEIVPISQNPISSQFHKLVYDIWSSLEGVPKPQEYMTWIMTQSFRDFLTATKGYHSDDILGALANFKKIIEDPGAYWIQGRPSIHKFFAGEIFQACRPGVFPAGALKEERKEKTQADAERAKFDAEVARLIAEEKAGRI